MSVFGTQIFIHLQEHTEDLQNKAMSSLFSLVCSMYKVQLISIKPHSLTLCPALLLFITSLLCIIKFIILAWA